MPPKKRKTQISALVETRKKKPKVESQNRDNSRRARAVYFGLATDYEPYRNF